MGSKSGLLRKRPCERESTWQAARPTAQVIAVSVVDMIALRGPGRTLCSARLLPGGDTSCMISYLLLQTCRYDAH